MPKRSSEDLDLLPAPGVRGTADEISDLPAPRGPAGSRMGLELDAPDLLAPAGPVPTRSGAEVDLPAPVGPAPTRGILDLPAPVGPAPTRGILDLPAPVGPAPTRGILDLPAPVGPLPTLGGVGGFDLPPPVGAAPAPGLDSLLSFDAPAGQAPAGNGLFGDAAPGHAAEAGPSGAAPAFQLDDLDLVPAGEPGSGAAEGPMSLPPLPPPAMAGSPGTSLSAEGSSENGFSLGGLDLMPPEPPPANLEEGKGGMAFGEVDLAGDAPPEEDPGAALVSFGRPSGASGGASPKPSLPGPGAPVHPDGDGSLDLSLGGEVRRPSGTLAGGESASVVAREKDAPARATGAQPEAKKAPKSAARKRRERIIAGCAGLAVLVVIGGYIGYSRWDKARARASAIRAGLVEARQFMRIDDPGHWDRAIESTRKVLAIDARNADALGLQAQSELASAIDEGTNEAEREEAANGALNETSRQGIQSDEVEKATALRSILDGKPEDARRVLKGLPSQASADPNIPLFQGWLELEAKNGAAARDAFMRALKQTPGRMPALYGLAKAQFLLGPPAWPDARQTFLKILDKQSGHVGARLGLVEMDPIERRQRISNRERSLAEILQSKEAATAHKRVLSRAWRLYGDEALRTGRLDQAGERFRKALELDFRNGAAQVGVCLVEIELGNLRVAREGACRPDPTDSRSLVALTRLALLEGKVSEARTAIDGAAGLDANDTDVQLWLGNVLAVDGPDYAGAEKAFRRAIELDRERYEPHIALSRLLLAQAPASDPARAEALRTQALEVLAPVEQAAKNDAAIAVLLGDAYLGAREAEQAATWFRSAIALDAKNVDAHTSLGRALEAQEKLDEAIAEYQTANQLVDGKREDLALDLARAYEKRRRFDDAAKVYAGMLANNEDRVPSLSARAAAGRFFARRGDSAQAAMLGESILATDAVNPAGLFLAGVGLASQDKIAEAKQSMSDAIRLDPQSQYFEGLGRLYERENALDDALAAYEQSVKRDANYAAPHVGRARIRMLRREWNLAQSELEIAAKLEPDSAEVQLRLGEVLYQRGANPKAREAAIPFLERSLVLDPKLVRAHYVLGQVYYEVDKRPQAITTLRRFVELAPKDDDALADAYRMLAFSYKVSNRHGEACAAFRNYMGVAPRGDFFRADAERYLYSCER